MFVGRANSQVSIERSSCGHNSARNRGGVVAIVGSSLVIDETNVFNNTARLGGAVSACNSDVTVPSELAETEDSTSSVDYVHFTMDSSTVSTLQILFVKKLVPQPACKLP